MIKNDLEYTHLLPNLIPQFTISSYSLLYENINFPELVWVNIQKATQAVSNLFHIWQHFLAIKVSSILLLLLDLAFGFNKDFLSIDDNCSNCLEMIPLDLSIVS